ncbi:hypothetical protein AZI86_06430 [Bdellovibrio bacteriovorus]|uniref:Cadherin domain-containing protein n=2 Tax=Bdellovibrio bacteriovorus TaxID=959 RepID=A0A150WQL0_BDEBC|nr:hypothetical protein AZI86_06430 [Bdellovibrio bacteriovorus]
MLVLAGCNSSLFFLGGQITNDSDSPSLSAPSVGDDGESELTLLPPVPGSAQWLAESSFTVSSLEKGRIGYLEAWGGDEFGYSYSYTLTGAPTGLTVDAETGMMSLSSPLSPGDYSFVVTVTNRKVISKSSQYIVKVHVLEGVTANRTGTQILHKTYNVDDSARFGSPTGSDYSTVLMNIHNTIIADQEAAGDGNLRATIQFRRNTLYQYANNRWPWGIQYLTVQTNPVDDPSLSRPQLQGTGTTGWNSLQGTIIRVGQSWGYNYNATDEANYENPRAYAYKIQTTTVGSNQIILKNPGDGTHIKPGRYHMVISYDQQMYGFPPNNRYFEYVKVVSVVGSVVTLDRKIRHIHRDDALEVNDPNSLGKARIVALDRGGVGGVNPRQNRLVLRSTWHDLEFVANPDGTEIQGEMVQMEGVLDAELNNCVMPHLVPSNLRHGRLVNSVLGSSEGDKQVGMFIVDSSQFQEAMLEYTSTDFLFLRNSQSATMSLMPRQLRIQNSVMDATNENYITVPLYVRGPWSTQKIEIVGTNITRTDTAIFAVGSGNPEPRAVLGTDATWSGNRLIIPLSSPEAERWVSAAWEGAIVLQGSLPPTSFGVIRKISAPVTNDAIYLDIDWLEGVQPTSGTVRMHYIHDLSIDATSTMGGQIYWLDPDAIKQTMPASMSTTNERQFPEKYPAASYGF